MSGNASATYWPPIPKQRKKRRLLQQIQALAPGAELLAQDETDLLLFPPLRAGWAAGGQPARVLISGHNARRVIFGSLHLRRGHMLCLEQARKRVEDFQEFLDYVRKHYRRARVAMLMDENSIHTNEESQSLAEDLDIQLLWLPKRSPHLNPMEHLWRHGKEAVCANYQHTSMNAQVYRFVDYYRQLSPRERLRKAGLESPDFWLHKLCHL
jgi:hypothetical protein